MSAANPIKSDRRKIDGEMQRGEDGTMRLESEILRERREAFVILFVNGIWGIVDD